MSKGDIRKAQELLEAAKRSIRYFNQEHDDCRRHWLEAEEHMEELKRQRCEAEMYLASVKS